MRGCFSNVSLMLRCEGLLVSPVLDLHPKLPIRKAERVGLAAGRLARLRFLIILRDDESGMEGAGHDSGRRVVAGDRQLISRRVFGRKVPGNSHVAI